MFVYILFFLPILIISIVKEEWYPLFFRMARGWSIFILVGMGFRPVVKREVKYKKGKSYMFVANHTSMTDIMLMLYVSKSPFVFVGKKELGKIPLFGFFYKRTCILVDRNNPKSRREVFESAQRKLNLGYSVCIFPEGGVPDDESIVLDEFKDGAFRLAINHNIPIAPMTFHDNKKRFSYTFFSGGPGKMRVMSHHLVPTEALTLNDRKDLKLTTRNIILNELETPSL
ncbi:MAG: lysophospholipid acyltransferase family protein [Flavobacteriaceae bacterium]